MLSYIRKKVFEKVEFENAIEFLERNVFKWKNVILHFRRILLCRIITVTDHPVHSSQNISPQIKRSNHQTFKGRIFSWYFLDRIDAHSCGVFVVFSRESRWGKVSLKVGAMLPKNAVSGRCHYLLYFVHSSVFTDNKWQSIPNKHYTPLSCFLSFLLVPINPMSTASLLINH